MNCNIVVTDAGSQVSKQFNSIVIYNQQKKKCQLFFEKFEYEWQSRPYREKKEAGTCKGF
jgi:hypothetical protein